MVAASILWLAAAARPAEAQISGSCDAVGYPAVRGAGNGIPTAQVTQLGTATRLSLPPDAQLTVQQASSQPSHRLDARAVFFGIGLPIAHWQGNDVRGTSGPWSLSGLARVSRVLGISAQSDACSGSVVVALDESPFVTLLGWLGLLLAGAGAALAGFVAARARAAVPRPPATTGRATAQRLDPIFRLPVEDPPPAEPETRGAVSPRHPRALAMGALLGLLAGVGAAAFLQETEVLSPLDGWALLVPIGGAIAGAAAIALAGAPRRSPSSSPGAVREPERPARLPSMLLGSLPRGVATGALVGLLVSVGPPLAGLSTYRSASLVSPGRAADVVRIYWDANNRAITTANPALRAPYEAGALRQATLHHLQALRTLGVKLKPQPIDALHVYVPQQSSYPGEFAASLDTEQVDGSRQLQHQTWYLLFTRQDAHAPWLAAMLAIAPTGNHAADFALGSDGYVSAWTSGEVGPVLSPAQVSGAYASYIDQGLRSGRARGPFASGPLTDQRVTALRSALQATASDLGVETSLDFQPTGQWYAFAGRDGSAVVFMDVDDTFQVSSKPPHCLVQQRGGRFDPLLPDGKYRDVRQSSTDQFLAIDSHRAVDVVGSSIQTQQATGDLGSGCA